MWYFHINQNEILVEVEIRPTEDRASGYISARKLIGFEPYGVEPAAVRVNLYLDKDLPLKSDDRLSANQLIEWLQLAHRLAGHLDELIKEPGDFKKKYGAKQYNPNSWATAFVELVREWVE